MPVHLSCVPAQRQVPGKIKIRADEGQIFGLCLGFCFLFVGLVLYTLAPFFFSATQQHCVFVETEGPIGSCSYISFTETG